MRYFSRKILVVWLINNVLGMRNVLQEWELSKT